MASLPEVSPSPPMNMKVWFTLFVVALLGALRAEELQPIPAEELAKATRLLMDANATMTDLPLKLELAADKATGFKAGDVGAILIPDRRLKAEKGDKTEKRKNKNGAIPVGQLWTLKLSPKEQDTVVPNEKLRLVKVKPKDREIELAVFSLGIERAGKKEFRLAVYGKDNSPVLRVPLTAAKAKGAAPAVMTPRQTGENSGVLELKLLGRFKAEIPMGKQAG